MASKPKHLRETIYGGLGQVMEPIGAALSQSGLTPNQVTWAGVCLNVVAALIVMNGYLVLGGVVWFLAGAFDTLDGAMARHEGLVSSYGSFLDSTTDRISDGAMFAALIYYFAAINEPLNATIVGVCLLAGFLTSYARAKAEALGAKCKGGLVTRGERVFVIGVGLLFGQIVPALYVLFVLSIITVAQRIHEAKSQLDQPASLPR